MMQGVIRTCMRCVGHSHLSLSPSSPSRLLLRRFSAEAYSQGQHATEQGSSFHQNGTPPESESRDVKSELARVLQAALPHVVKHGWSETAIISGARDVGMSPSIVGSFPRKEAALVEHFMDECLQKLIDKIQSDTELPSLIVSQRVAKLVRTRLEMQTPFLSRWPQALSIQAQPINIPTSFKQRAMLADEIWHASGNDESDIDWYVKRATLGGIYSTTELYMLTDHSPDFHDTWMFLDSRVKDAFDIRKSLQEAAYLAEAVGAGIGNSVQGFMKRVLHQ